jgi:hypothetical protein
MPRNMPQAFNVPQPKSGLAPCTEHGSKAGQLIRHAKSSMYKNKTARDA